MSNELMKHRLSHITISGEEIINKSNDNELGAFVRNRYWSTFNLREPDMICSLCGNPTSEVEYDYLSGTDHISCILNSELKK